VGIKAIRAAVEDCRRLAAMKSRFLISAALASVALLLPSTGHAADYDTILGVSWQSASPFYPFVVDGYRDDITSYVSETHLDYEDIDPYCEIDGAGVSEAVVIDANDTVVRHITAYTVYMSDPYGDTDAPFGEHSVGLSWDGRDDTNSFVPMNAYYRFRVTATPTCWMDQSGTYVVAGYGDTETVTSSPFLAARKTLIKDSKDVIWGGDPSKTGHSSGCSVRIDSDSWLYPDQTTLRCRGGKYAFASYVFHIPSNAYDVHYDFKGSGTYYGPSYWKPLAKRPRADKVVFRVRVGGYIKYHIYKVWLTYSYKQQL
jgi:hypothetical protein